MTWCRALQACACCLSLWVHVIPVSWFLRPCSLDFLHPIFISPLQWGYLISGEQFDGGIPCRAVWFNIYLSHSIMSGSRHLYLFPSSIAGSFLDGGWIRLWSECIAEYHYKSFYHYHFWSLREFDSISLIIFLHYINFHNYRIQ